MPLITTLNLQDRPQHSHVRLLATGRNIPLPYASCSAVPSRGSIPGRGLLYSLLVHQVLLFSTLFVQAYAGYFQEPPPPQELLLMMDIRHETKLIYFPSAGAADEGARHEDAVAKDSESPVAKRKAAPGISYPGPQTIVSDFPNPTNRFQTLLQPALENPAVIPPPIMLPNVIQLADAGPLPKVDLPKPMLRPQEPPKPVVRQQIKLAETDKTLLVAANTVPVRVPTKAARVTLPTGAPDIPPPPEPKPVEPPPPPATEQPKVAQPAPVPVTGPDKQNILSITPMPAPPEPVLKVPNGEARGRVTISPEPNLTASAAAPAVRPAAVTPPTPTPPPSTPPAPEPPVVPPAPAKTANEVPAKEAEPAKPKPAENSDTAAAPKAAPRSPFGGMTITGGRLETGSASNSTPARTGVITLGAPPKTSSNSPSPTGSYGMTIVSTGNSGGGLPDFGVFLRQKVYTVYLDMKQPNGAAAPSWTLQYAVMADPSSTTTVSSEGIIPPYPTVKVQPDFPADASRRYARRLVIVYAIINKEGKLQDMSVKQSPDPQLNPLALTALGKWTFRPAELNGEPVAVKALIGIPIPE